MTTELKVLLNFHFKSCKPTLLTNIPGNKQGHLKVEESITNQDIHFTCSDHGIKNKIQNGYRDKINLIFNSEVECRNVKDL